MARREEGDDRRVEGEGRAAARRERVERRRGEGRQPAARMERVGAEGEGQSGGAERVGRRPATRRERIRDGGGAGGCAAAAADGISYLGDVSVYQVLLASGKRLRVTQANIMRGNPDAITWDEQVYLTWGDSAGSVLTV